MSNPKLNEEEGEEYGGNGETVNTSSIEPSSPKVTCIGQVRVKTRKHVKNKMKARSRRKGETSFRRSSLDKKNGEGGGCRFDAIENRWVHLLVTICESLRTFGSELNCFFPCSSSCTDSNHHNRDIDGRPVQKSDGCGGENSCDAVFTRWFVPVEDTPGGKRREIDFGFGSSASVMPT